MGMGMEMGKWGKGACILWTTLPGPPTQNASLLHFVSAVKANGEVAFVFLCVA